MMMMMTMMLVWMMMIVTIGHDDGEDHHWFLFPLCVLSRGWWLLEAPLFCNYQSIEIIANESHRSVYNYDGFI